MSDNGTKKKTFYVVNKAPEAGATKNAVLHFLYNPETGAICGRTLGSWCKLLKRYKILQFPRTRVNFYNDLHKCTVRIAFPQLRSPSSTSSSTFACPCSLWQCTQCLPSSHSLMSVPAGLEMLVWLAQRPGLDSDQCRIRIRMRNPRSFGSTERRIRKALIGQSHWTSSWEPVSLENYYISIVIQIETQF